MSTSINKVGSSDSWLRYVTASLETVEAKKKSKKSSRKARAHKRKTDLSTLAIPSGIGQELGMPIAIAIEPAPKACKCAAELKMLDIVRKQLAKEGAIKEVEKISEIITKLS